MKKMATKFNCIEVTIQIVYPVENFKTSSIHPYFVYQPAYQKVFLKNGNPGAAARKEERAIES